MKSQIEKERAKIRKKLYDYLISVGVDVEGNNYEIHTKIREIFKEYEHINKKPIYTTPKMPKINPIRTIHYN